MYSKAKHIYIYIYILHCLDPAVTAVQHWRTNKNHEGPERLLPGSWNEWVDDLYIHENPLWQAGFGNPTMYIYIYIATDEVDNP